MTLAERFLARVEAATRLIVSGRDATVLRLNQEAMAQLQAAHAAGWFDRYLTVAGAERVVW